MGRRRVLAGIELGRSCRVAIFDPSGRARLINAGAPDESTPSSLLFNEYSVLFGRSAQDALPTLNGFRVEDFLRHLGDPNWSYRAFQRSYPAEALVALLLSRLLQNVLLNQNQTVSDVVLAVPGFMSPRQRSALFTAGRMAGVNVLDVIDSVAVVGLDPSNSLLESARGASLHIHFGDDSLDAALVEFQAGQRRVLSCRGRWSLGLRAWNEVAAVELAERLRELEGIDLRLEANGPAELSRRAAQAMRELERHDQVRVQLDYRERATIVSLERNRLNLLTRPLLENSRAFAIETVRDRAISGAQLNAVFLTGEPILKSLARDAIAEAFPRKVQERGAPQPAIGALTWASRMIFAIDQQGLSPDDMRHPDDLARLVPPPLRQLFERIELLRPLDESLGVEVETLAGLRRLELTGPNQLVPTQLSRQVMVTGPAMASAAGVLPRRQGQILLHILGGDGDDPAQLDSITEFEIADPHSIRSALNLDLRFAEGASRLAIDITDTSTQELLLSETIDLQHRRGAISEGLTERWRRDLKQLSDEGPASLPAL